MINAIMIWIIAIFSLVWIIYRGYSSRKMINNHVKQNEDIKVIQAYVKKSIAKTALIILIVWWASFIMVESMKLKVLNYHTSFHYQVIGVLSIGLILIALHYINNRNINKKYNVCIYDKSISIERTLCIIISLVYALIASYAVEALVMYTT